LKVAISEIHPPISRELVASPLESAEHTYRNQCSIAFTLISYKEFHQKRKIDLEITKVIDINQYSMTSCTLIFTKLISFEYNFVDISSSESYPNLTKN